MNNLNKIYKEDILLERPNLINECNINTDDEMSEYLALYNVYNNFLIQYIMKKFHLINVDMEMIKHKERFAEVPYDDQDLYQKSANGYLKYLYLRNNLYVERLTSEEKNYFLSLYNQGINELNDNIENNIEKTYLKVILENPNENDIFINYGPDNMKFMAPTNSLVIGIRCNEFSSLSSNDTDLYLKTISDLQMTKRFLEASIKSKFNIPTTVIIYNEYSVKCRKKEEIAKNKA